MGKKKAFTLIELLVVIAIIALLLAILVPALSKAKDHAKMVLCAANQHEIVAAVGVYAGNNNGKLPPAISGDATSTSGLGGMSKRWIRPTRLNTMPENGTGFPGKGFNGGYHGKYLFRYLPEVEIYNCPFSPIEGGTIVDSSTGLTYQENYEKGIVNADCSYLFLWNYQGFDNSVSPTRIIGPGSINRKASTLLVSDVLFWSNTWAYPEGGSGQTKMWASTHPFKGSAKDTSAYVHHILRDTNYDVSNPQLNPQLSDIRYNAGYLDGSVRKYISRDTIVAQNNQVHMYLTKTLR